MSDKYIPREQLEHLMWKPEDDLPSAKPEPSPMPQTQPSSSQLIDGKYVHLPVQDTYGLAVKALREACIDVSDSPHPTFIKDDGSDIYRPLTFKEIIRARVDDFNTSVAENGEKRSILLLILILMKTFYPLTITVCLALS